MVLALLIIVAVVGAPARAETPDEVFSFANHLKRDGLNEAAAQQFLRFARENPTDRRAPEALLSAADCLNQSGGTEQAVTVLEAIVNTYPDLPEQCKVEVQLGRLYAKLERHEDADRTFTRVAVTMPDCALVPDALLGKGEALMAQKNYAAASEVLRGVVENHVESKAAPRAAYGRAVCLSRLGRQAEAMAEFERVVARFPGDPLAGFAALEAARMQAARGEVERAVTLYARA